jgi:protein PhnA
MAKGYDTNQERKQALSLLGKDLARRAKSKCELTQASGVPLVTYELPPVPNDPEFERCLLVSEDVLAQLNKPSKLRADEWRHLSELIWSAFRPCRPWPFAFSAISHPSRGHRTSSMKPISIPK